jgi:imidazolonepropionase-like amidohydrolase
MRMALLFVVLACAREGAVQRTSAPGDTVIEDVSVVDPAAGVLREHQTVVIHGSRIVAGSAPAGARKIAGAGKFLVPGLIDMHAHVR